ncbi:MAG: glycosyltransferase family 2 protein [Candidatus Shapirobacteria bacterium]|nr:glycosyltransferase family 2 protein [Candidatus Shapirobacteria bacterium]
MIQKNLSIIVLAGNEEQMIVDCLKSCNWTNEIILVAANSTDNTVNLAKKTIPSIKIIKTKDEYNKNFSKWRNLGYQAATKDWILYIDADERIPLKLKKEIISNINKKNNKISHYDIPRANHYLGKRVHFGGSYPDYVKRLYCKKYFKGYKGILHEEPLIVGFLEHLKSDLLHYTHRDLNSMVNKTLAWTDMEAKALFQNNHPPVVWWRFIRMMLTKIWQRLIIQKMWCDGTVGWISVLFETFDTFLIYARLWEIQQKQNNQI